MFLKYYLCQLKFNPVPNNFNHFSGDKAKYSDLDSPNLMKDTFSEQLRRTRMIKNVRYVGAGLFISDSTPHSTPKVEEGHRTVFQQRWFS